MTTQQNMGVDVERHMAEFELETWGDRLHSPYLSRRILHVAVRGKREAINKFYAQLLHCDNSDIDLNIVADKTMRRILKSLLDTTIFDNKYRHLRLFENGGLNMYMLLLSNKYEHSISVSPHSYYVISKNIYNNNTYTISGNLNECGIQEKIVLKKIWEAIMLINDIISATSTGKIDAYGTQVVFEHLEVV